MLTCVFHPQLKASRLPLSPSSLQSTLRSDADYIVSLAESQILSPSLSRHHSLCIDCFQCTKKRLVTRRCRASRTPTGCDADDDAAFSLCPQSFWLSSKCLSRPRPLPSSKISATAASITGLIWLLQGYYINYNS